MNRTEEPRLNLRYPDLRSEVVRCCPAGHPLVLRCHPLFLERGLPKPFPTLFWLACDHVHGTIARFESAGGVRLVQQRLRDDPALMAALHADHLAYAAERESLLTERDRALFAEHGVRDGFANRGIGGIRDLTSIKCLHLHYAHHLARGNTVGRLVDEHIAITLCEQSPVDPGNGSVA